MWCIWKNYDKWSQLTDLFVVQYDVLCGLTSVEAMLIDVEIRRNIISVIYWWYGKDIFICHEWLIMTASQLRTLVLLLHTCILEKLKPDHFSMECSMTLKHKWKCDITPTLFAKSPALSQLILYFHCLQPKLDANVIFHKVMHIHMHTPHQHSHIFIYCPHIHIHVL